MTAQSVSVPHVSPLRKAAYFVELYLLYFWVALRLKRHGMKEAAALCMRQRTFRGVGGGLSAEQFVFLTRDLTRSVIKWHVLPSTCVPDSLLPCWFLGRRGIKAEFIIMVRHFPFMAHAQAFWNDHALTDPPPEWSMQDKFVVLMRR